MILCCGEALIDMIPAPTTQGLEGYVPHAGGAVFNSAVALGRLGCASGLLTGLSNDLFGQQLRIALEASRVDTSLVVTSGHPTTLAFVRLVDGQATYTFYDENSAGRSLTVDQMPDLPDSVSALFFGGISLCSEPCADAYLALAERASKSRTVMLDPNIRPDFIANEDKYRARLGRMFAVADIVKVSADDLDWLFDDDAPKTEKAARLLSEGPSIVLLTLGEKGALALRDDQPLIRIPAQPANVVDTVAAGDTFNAGFLARLYQSGQLGKTGLGTLDAKVLEDAMLFAARAAAKTVSRAGANPPWAEEMKI